MTAGEVEPTRVSILDEPFSIRSAAPAEYTRDVARHVDSVLRDLRKSAPMEPFPTAVLGAMEITDDLFRTRERLATTARDAAIRLERLADRIEAELATEETEHSTGEEGVKE